MILAIDHIQLAMPVGGEPAAREFYGRLLGLREVPKPEPLAARGGAWFEGGEVRLHLGVEDDFRPARKAHPALLVAQLAALKSKLAAAGYEVRDDSDLPDVQRAFTHDPFGNRIELIQSPTEGQP